MPYGSSTGSIHAKGTQASTSRRRRVRLIAALVPALLIATFIGTVPARSAFPGTGGRIVFNREYQHLFDVRPDGRYERQLTDGYDGFPAWSPDGTRLVFERDRDIFVADADGSDATNLTPTSDAFDSYPVWSPDGRRIAFSSDRLGGYVQQIFLMDPDGSDVEQLTMDGGGFPAWSPDGSTIAFTKLNDDLYVIGADGTGEHALTHDAASEFLPDWSPDGTQIAFQRSTREGHDVWVIDATGENAVNLTNDSTFDGHPAWSPDGSRIAFVREEPGAKDIFVMDPDGSDRVNITNTLATDEFEPDWQPLDTLLRDGSFEDPTLAAGGIETITAGGYVGQWLVRAGSVDVVHRRFWEAAFQRQSLDLGGLERGTIAQSIRTVPGATYTVRFSMAGNPGCGEEVKRMRVSWAGDLVGRYSADTTGTSNDDMAWTVHTADVVADAARAKLVFRALNGGACGPALDAVSVLRVVT